MSLFKKYFSKQAKAEMLFSSLKNLKKKSKELSQIEFDYNYGFTDIDIFGSLKSARETEYREKKIKYCRLLYVTKFKASASSPTSPLEVLEQFLFEDYVQNESGKVKILEKLIELSNYIIETGDEQAIDKFKILESKLYGYLNYIERNELSITIHPFELFIYETNQRLRSTKSFLISQLQSLFKSGYNIKCIRDLRNYFRTLIKLLFKNLDDEHNKLVVFNFLKIDSTNCSENYNPNGKERINNAFTFYKY